MARGRRAQAFALARVRAAFLAAVLRSVALRLRVAAAFFAAAWRLAGPPVARSSRSATSLCRSAIRMVAAFDAREPCALLSASESSLATRLRSPFARNLSNSASAWELAIGIVLLSGTFLGKSDLPVQAAAQSAGSGLRQAPPDRVPHELHQV